MASPPPWSDGAEEAAEGDAPAQEVQPCQGVPTPGPPASLRHAAQRLLDAWDDEANQRYDLTDAMDAMRAILAKPARATREPGAPRKPREGTKQETAWSMLRRK